MNEVFRKSDPFRTEFDGEKPTSGRTVKGAHLLRVEERMNHLPGGLPDQRIQVNAAGKDRKVILVLEGRFVLGNQDATEAVSVQEHERNGPVVLGRLNFDGLAGNGYAIVILARPLDETELLSVLVHGLAEPLRLRFDKGRHVDLRTSGVRIGIKPLDTQGRMGIIEAA